MSEIEGAIYSAQLDTQLETPLSADQRARLEGFLELRARWAHS